MVTACMPRSWEVEVCQKKHTLSNRDDQSALSSKNHVKYEATQIYLSVTYQHDLLDRQTITATELVTTATTEHTAYISQRVFSGK